MASAWLQVVIGQSAAGTIVDENNKKKYPRINGKGF